MARLDCVIKARHVQLGGYSHDECEHLLEARRLLTQGHDSQARLEVALALEKRALHAREAAKYRNLVALRQTLQEAKRNITLAELMKTGGEELQNAILEIMPALPVQNPSMDQPLLMRDHPLTAAAAEEENQPEKATEEQVAAELALLRLPPTPSGAPIRQKVALTTE